MSTASKTRRASYEAVQMTSGPTQEERALAHIKKAGVYGMTDWELSQKLNTDRSTAAARRCRLVDQCLVHRASPGFTRVGGYGKQNAVWFSVDLSYDDIINALNL